MRGNAPGAATMAGDPLAIKRTGRCTPRPGPVAVADRIALWNLLAPPGTKVRYFPTWGRWGEWREGTIRAPASVLGSGEPVLWLENTSGCVSAWHCEPMPGEATPAQR